MRNLEGSISELLNITKTLYGLVVERLEECSCLGKSDEMIEACKKADLILAVFDNWDRPKEELSHEEISHTVTCIAFRIQELEHRLDRLMAEDILDNSRTLYDSIKRTEREILICHSIEKKLSEKEI